MRLIRHATFSTSIAILCLVAVGRASAEDFPKGTFTLKGPDDKVASITFDGKGKLSVKVDDEDIVQCDYKVTKDQVEFSNETGPRANSDAKPGTYKWKLTGKKLTFTKIKDDSQGRAEALTFGTWEKKE
jgi:hypothetical protein